MTENKQLAIKDLQKGMMVKGKFPNITYDKLLVIEYVCIRSDHVVGIDYAIGLDETNEPVLLTNNMKITLAEEKKDQDTGRASIVICSACGQQMEIKEWMQANLHGAWALYGDEFKIPHMNRSHPCKCGKLWLSTDALANIGNILVWEYCP